MGRSITIEESQGKKNNNFGGQQGGFGGGFNKAANNNYPAPGNATIETPTLFIGGLSYNSTVDSIRDYFSSAGEVSSARIVTDK